MQGFPNVIPITGVQSKMARAALGLGVRELAAAASVSADTVVRFEKGETLQPRTIAALRQALEAAGVEFIPENGGGPGVRLQKTGVKSGAPRSVGPEDEARGGPEAPEKPAREQDD